MTTNMPLTFVNPRFFARIGSPILMSGLLCAFPALTLAQAIQPVASGRVQGVVSNMNQRVATGTVAGGSSGERSGAGGFGVSEGGGRVVSGRAAGYAGPQIAGRLGEYGSLNGSGFGSGQDFPETDFVATMPRPQLGRAGVASAGTGSGFGVTLNSPPISTGSAHRTSSVTKHAAVNRQIKDPDAILNPFTHPIGSALTGVAKDTPGGSGLGSDTVH